MKREAKPTEIKLGDATDRLMELSIHFIGTPDISIVTYLTAQLL